MGVVAKNKRNGGWKKCQKKALFHGSRILVNAKFHAVTGKQIKSPGKLLLLYMPVLLFCVHRV